MKQLLSDGEIILSLTFNPSDASNAIASGELPDTVRSYVHDAGSIGNTHFVGIPYNSNNTAAAQVVANFLMSPEAQARKANTEIWGDPTVLAMDKLTPADRALFEQLPQGVATLSADELGAVLREPDPSWVSALERTWQQRYAN
jgi:putative thiamine transport system substrate-binding protein